MNVRQKVILATVLGASLAFMQGNPVLMVEQLLSLVPGSVAPDVRDANGESASQQMGLSIKRLDDDLKRSSGSFFNGPPCSSSQSYSLVPCIGTTS